ncbi:MAG: DUF2284 domain-containing protein [Faecalibacterium sp.]
MQDMELVAKIEALGAAHAGIVNVADIHFDPAFRELCVSNACGNYGKCWMCPPDAGDIHELIARAKTFDKALVYQTIGTLEDSYDFEGMMEAADVHNQLARKALAEFSALPFQKHLHLGAGGCHQCPVCAKRTNEPCRFPEKAMASLETYGVAVSELAVQAKMNYINGQDTVTYFSAFLYTE